MKTTKKQLQEIKEVEKKVAKVCGAEKSKVIFDEITDIPYAEREIQPKETIKVTRNDDGVIVGCEKENHYEKKTFDLKDCEIQLSKQNEFGDTYKI